MGKLYKIVELERLHRTRTAVNGKVYEDVNRVKYIGNPQGFLERQKDLKGDVTNNTLGSSVEQVGDYSTEGLMNKLDEIDTKVEQEEFEEYKKQAKCFAIAMSITL